MKSEVCPLFKSDQAVSEKLSRKRVNRVRSRICFSFSGIFREFTEEIEAKIQQRPKEKKIAQAGERVH